MPGHKARGDFRARFKDAAMDITELSYSDNLHSPEGVIQAAQRDVAEIVGAKASFITTDGSSSGIFAMLYAAARRGNKVLVSRNSHRSVWNACALLGLEPLIVSGGESEGILLPPDRDVMERLLVNDVNICAIVLTSPDYYGNILPLYSYKVLAHKYNRLLIVDGAHGAHLAFEEDRNGYAGVFADMWVDGAHKTLPTLTQGAAVHVNDESLIPLVEEGLGIFRTTSPSYPIMASVEYGYKYCANRPERIERAKAAVAAFRREVKDSLPLLPSDDWTKLVVDFKPFGISADRAAERLERKGIYPELSDGRYVIFYLSPQITALDLKTLKIKLFEVIRIKKLRSTYVERPLFPVTDRSYSYQYAIRKPAEYVPLKDAAGRMCARNAGFAPPCVPVVVAGEIITPAAIDALGRAHSTFGLKDGKICVVRQ